VNIRWVLLAVIVNEMLIAALEKTLTKRLCPNELPEEFHLQRIVQEIVFQAEISEGVGSSLNVTIHI